MGKHRSYPVTLISAFGLFCISAPSVQAGLGQNVCPAGSGSAPALYPGSAASDECLNFQRTWDPKQDGYGGWTMIDPVLTDSDDRLDMLVMYSQIGSGFHTYDNKTTMGGPHFVSELTCESADHKATRWPNFADLDGDDTIDAVALDNARGGEKQWTAALFKHDPPAYDGYFVEVAHRFGSAPAIVRGYSLGDVDSELSTTPQCPTPSPQPSPTPTTSPTPTPLVGADELIDLLYFTDNKLGVMMAKNDKPIYHSGNQTVYFDLQNLPSSHRIKGMRLADFDQDGDEDIVLVSWKMNTYEYYLHPIKNLRQESPCDCDRSDYVASSNSQIAFPSDCLLEEPVIQLQNYYHSMRTGYINGDDQPDLIISYLPDPSNPSSRLGILNATSSFGFESELLFATNIPSYQINSFEAADIKKDGGCLDANGIERCEDVVLLYRGNYMSAHIMYNNDAWLSNSGGGTGTPTPTSTGTPFPSPTVSPTPAGPAPALEPDCDVFKFTEQVKRLRLGDLNADGHIDIGMERFFGNGFLFYDAALSNGYCANTPPTVTPTPNPTPTLNDCQ